MESGHIESHKLYEVVTENAVLEQREIQHLEICEECLQQIRFWVRQLPRTSKKQPSKDASASN